MKNFDSKINVISLKWTYEVGWEEVSFNSDAE
jgi:hypothetical protein